MGVRLPEFEHDENIQLPCLEFDIYYWCRLSDQIIGTLKIEFYYRLFSKALYLAIGRQKIAEISNINHS